jgi:cation diffusion facilitator family transporter
VTRYVATDAYRRGIRAAQVGMAVNAGLAAIKLVAGVVGHTYALVADAVESTVDIVGSVAVWSGLAVAARPADEDHPYGHGKAESLAALAVALLVLAAGVGIAIEAVREIATPNRPPAPWTLGVLVGVVIVKWILSRRVKAVGVETESHAVEADAWHHLSDAVTSAAAFIGIAIALVGSRLSPDPRWATADDWAALAASGVIVFNGVGLLRRAMHDLMDRAPDGRILDAVRVAALAVPRVLDVEKLTARKAGLVYYVDIHVQADPRMPLEEAHAVGGRVKAEIRRAVPQVAGVLVHMEPFQSDGPSG